MDQMLSRSGGNSIIVYLNKSYLEAVNLTCSDHLSRTEAVTGKKQQVV